ncbi:MAG: succinylglutamate desuccinylase/aspartoacylase family protein [Cytophagales bacterium]|nr:succinylglutamate desuccinylase/aspartoacylase family protein [Cytophagales bacterium]
MLSLKRTLTTILFIFTLGGLHAQEQILNKIKFNKPGSREDFEVKFVDRDQRETSLPVVLLKGKRRGPIFTIVAGVHGYEYPPIIAVQELLEEVDPQELRGSLVILPMANKSSFYDRSPFVSDLDGVNLNNAFPGDPNGSVTQKIAAFISKEVIPYSYGFLDIHGGDANEDLLPFVCYYNNRNRPNETSTAANMAEASGFEYVVSYPYTLQPTDSSKYAFKEASQFGKVALSIECGKLGNVQEEAVAKIKDGVYRILDYMNMVELESVEKHPVKRLSKQTYIKADHQGIFYSDLKAGDEVKIDQSVALIKNEFGKVIHEVKSPASGIILYKIGTPPVNIGETIMCIASEN